MSFVLGLFVGIGFYYLWSQYTWWLGLICFTLGAVVFEIYKYFYNIDPDFVVHNEIEDNIELEEQLTRTIKEVLEKVDEQEKKD